MYRCDVISSSHRITTSLRRLISAKQVVEIRSFFNVWTLLRNCFFEDCNSNLFVTHRASLLFLLVRSRKPFHDAFRMEDVSAARDFSDLRPILECFHTYHAIRCSELINVFVLFVFDDRDQFLILFNKLFVDLLA